MEINATSSATTLATTATKTSSGQNTKTSEESSFKNEMDKVNGTDKKEKESNVEKKDTKEVKDEKKEVESSKNKKENTELINKPQENEAAAQELNYNQINSMLSNDIQRMMYNSSQFDIYENEIQLFGSVTYGEEKTNTSLKMTENDANFFIELANKENVNPEGISNLAQTYIENGAEVQQVQQNAKISQALLDALNVSREKNQPVRIDFDKDISVILRINQQGQISATFIPGDKAVEQYLKQNIATLKNTFDENNLPYSDLSYSNSSKEQNSKRRNEKQQGE